MKIACALAVVIGVSGCAATGRSYQEFSQSIVASETKARLVLFRTTETRMASAAAASVKIDGTPAGYVEFGGFSFIETQPGRHVLTVDQSITRGQCDLSVDLAPGNEYYFQVKPRVESLGGLGLIPLMIAKGDQPWSPNRSECKGSFYAEPIEKNDALEKLKELKSSQ